MKKINGFTLMELLIGMIISSIITGICYGGYRAITGLYVQFHRQKQEVSEVMSLQAALNIDFNKGEQIRYEDQLLTVEQDSLSVTYTFEDSCVIRNQNDVNDTFRFAPTDIKAENIGSGRLVREFSFNVEKWNTHMYLMANKTYDAALLIKEELKNGH